MPLSFHNFNLCESIQKNKPLIVVDIQPEYEYAARNVIASELFKDLINSQSNILWYFNGLEQVPDEESDVKSLLRGNGFSEETINKIKFSEKRFFFLRKWMEAGVASAVIIKVLRAMKMQRVSWSDEINLVDCLGEKDMAYMSRIFPGKIPTIQLPDYISIKALKEMDGGYIIGGVRSRCLKEITLIMNAFNIKYTMIDSLIF